MLFRKKVKKKAGPIELTVDRESVCMGDDVTAPNEKIFPVAENETLSDVMEKICAYLPQNERGSLVCRYRNKDRSLYRDGNEKQILV